MSRSNTLSYDASSPVEPQTQRLHDDFTRHGKLQDLGRWYITGFVERVAASLPEGTSVLDAGAGECSYKRLFSHCRYTAVDLAVGDNSWNYQNLDHVAPLDQLPFEDHSYDAVLCTQVLEHLERPSDCLSELYRVLKPGGRLYLTAPMSHFEHQVPYDFFRYTSFGLDSLLKGAAFKENQITPFGGIFTRWAYELPRAMNFFPGTGLLSGRFSVRGLLLFPMKIVCAILVRIIQRVFLFLDRFDKQRNDPFGWAVVSTK
jgi:SAM-dependent methyltransferase